MGRIIVAVIVAGILGCIATGAAVAGLTGADFAAFATTWGKYVVSIIIACLLPLVYRSMAEVPAYIVGVVVLDAVAAVVTMVGFNGPAWVPVILFNLVYAVVATFVYAAIMGRVGTRTSLAA